MGEFLQEQLKFRCILIMQIGVIGQGRITRACQDRLQLGDQQFASDWNVGAGRGLFQLGGQSGSVADPDGVVNLGAQTRAGIVVLAASSAIR